MVKLQRLQHELLDRYLEQGEAPERSPASISPAPPAQARRFMKMVESRKEQILDRMLLERD